MTVLLACGALFVALYAILGVVVLVDEVRFRRQVGAPRCYFTVDTRSFCRDLRRARRDIDRLERKSR